MSEPDSNHAVTLRTPTPDDVATLAALHVATWQEAYRGVFSDTFLDALDPESRLGLWRHVTDRIAAGDDLPRAAIAERDGRAVGFALSGITAEDDAPVDLSLFAIYTFRAEHGTGLGDRLLAHVLGDDEPAYLWVADANPRAIAFYHRHGFALDGVERADDDGADGPVRVVRMVRTAA